MANYTFSTKDFEKWLNNQLSGGMKINGLHPTYYIKADVRGNIHNKMGTLIRRHNPTMFNKLYKKLGKTALHQMR